MITIKAGVEFTFRGTKGKVTGTGYVKVLFGKFVILDLSDG